MNKEIEEEKLDNEIEMIVVMSDGKIEYNKELNIVVDCINLTSP